jgi:hypothetical protein
VSQLTPYQGCGLVQHFQHVPRVLLSPCGVQNRPHGRDRAAVFPDHLPDVFLRDPPLMTRADSPVIPCTRTSSGLSTRAFAMCSTRSMMAVVSPPVVITLGAPHQPCTPAGHETTRASGRAVAGRWCHLAQPHGRRWRADARPQDSAV